MKKIWLLVTISCLLTAMPVVAADPVKILTTSGVIVRELPEKTAPVVATLRQDMTLTVLDQEGDYSRVSDDSLTGWVWAKLLQKNADGTFTVTSKGAFANPKPEKGGSVGIFRAGTKVKLVEVKATWYKVNANGKTGWISASLVKLAK